MFASPVADEDEHEGMLQNDTFNVVCCSRFYNTENYLMTFKDMCAMFLAFRDPNDIQMHAEIAF
jgi:hypothetical protein